MRFSGKKLLSLALALIMVLGMVPVGAFAAEPTRGICGEDGDNLSWTLENGILTISGTGRMALFQQEAPGPWWGSIGDIKNQIRQINIEEGVTNITWLAFSGCSNVTSVTIPGSVAEIEGNPFASNLLAIQVAPDNQNYTSIDGVVYTKDLKTIVAYPGGKQGAYTIPNGVTVIDAEAFHGCTGLTNVTIPSSLTVIADLAFSGCSSLKSVIIPNSVTGIGRVAFSDCSSLTEITIPNNVTEYGVFSHCESLKKVTFLNGVTDVGFNMFEGCNNLEQITIPKSITKIPEGAFDGCSNIKDVYYSGSKEDWAKISFDRGNTYLTDATVHYNSTGPMSTISYTVSFDACGGIMSTASGSSLTASKSVTVGEPYGDLPTPMWDGFAFDGWYTLSGSQVTASTIVTQAQDHALFAHWVDPYNLGDETYSFKNFWDSDSPIGHCFGMSMTSSGYHNNLLDIGQVGGNASTPLYSFGDTQTVKQPICYYQGIQGSYSDRAIVAGGSFDLKDVYNMASDWQAVVAYVRDHSYDDTGLLQIVFRKDKEGGHAVNFLRYENVNGQDRLFAYDNNFPTKETYFYRDSSGSVRQAPAQTFSGAIDSIALLDCRTYFDIAGDFDATHVLYMAENAASVEGEYTHSRMYMETASVGGEYIMYEIPANVDRVTIIPKIDNATFIYMDEAYKFGEITDDTRGELKLAAVDSEGAVDTKASFQMYEDNSVGSKSFTDVPANAWYHDPVYWAVEKKVTTGTSETTFTPDRVCTETEILTFLWRAAGKPGSSAKLPFTVNASLKFAEAPLRWAYEKGMIDGSYNQTAPCTRATAVKFIWQAAGCPATAVANSFTDIPTGAVYAQAVAWAVDRGITAGTTSITFSPDKTCTRAEIVTFLHRAYK